MRGCVFYHAPGAFDNMLWPTDESQLMHGIAVEFLACSAKVDYLAFTAFVGDVNGFTVF